MTGQELLDLCTEVLGGESPNDTYLLTLINLSKTKIENKRPWQVLKTLDKTLTVQGSNTYLTPFTLPTNFKRYLGESSLHQGELVLFDGTRKEYLTEVPYEQILDYKDMFGYFAVDYSNGKFYIMGIVPGNFTIYQWYQKKTETITLATSWTNFYSDFHPILAFDACARWRLGTDYDDVNARNADDNGKMVNDILEAMIADDTEKAISSINNIDYQNNNYQGISGYGPRGFRV